MEQRCLLLCLQKLQARSVLSEFLIPSYSAGSVLIP